VFSFLKKRSVVDDASPLDRRTLGQRRQSELNQAGTYLLVLSGEPGDCGPNPAPFRATMLLPAANRRRLRPPRHRHPAGDGLPPAAAGHSEARPARESLRPHWVRIASRQGHSIFKQHHVAPVWVDSARIGDPIDVDRRERCHHTGAALNGFQEVGVRWQTKHCSGRPASKVCAWALSATHCRAVWPLKCLTHTSSPVSMNRCSSHAMASPSFAGRVGRHAPNRTARGVSNLSAAGVWPQGRAAHHPDTCRYAPRESDADRSAISDEAGWRQRVSIKLTIPTTRPPDPLRPHSQMMILRTVSGVAVLITSIRAPGVIGRGAAFIARSLRTTRGRVSNRPRRPHSGADVVASTCWYRLTRTIRTDDAR
jgi:hypothetical protein